MNNPEYSNGHPSTDGDELINVNKYRIVVVIPAAGSSERFRQNHIQNKLSPGSPKSTAPTATVLHALKSGSKHEQPKQYQNICGRPLIFHTVSAFLKIKWVDFIVVIGPQESLPRMEQILAPFITRQQKRFDCIVGADTRHRSIKIGLDYIESQEPKADIVVVHDGARPFVDQDTLHKLITNAQLYGAAGIVCKLTSTIVNLKADPLSDQYRINSALNRSEYWASEMPQAFKASLLIDAYSKCTETDFEINTECLDLLQRHTHTEARLFEVDPNLYFKVTYRKDLYTADNILKEHRNILLHFDSSDKSITFNYKFIKDLKDDLCATFSAVNYFNNSTVNDRYQSNAAHHSTGFVHVRLHHCHEWSDVLVDTNNAHLTNYEHLVYLVIICPNPKIVHPTPLTAGEIVDLDDSAFPPLTRWARSKVTKKEIKNFYFIIVHSSNLAPQSERIRSTLVYLSRELPTELSGQAFFM